MKKNILLFIGIAFLISCDKEDLEISTTDDAILELAYDKIYQYPVGFYHETDLIGNEYYENTVSVKPLNEREHIWIELNTNDKEEARTWSNLSNEYSSVNREIVQENETDKYFEFLRVNIENEKDKLLSRVHRSDYFISNHDKFKNIDEVGIFNGDLSLSNTKELIEYLWCCGTLGLHDKVIESKINEKGNRFEYHVQSLRIVYGDFGLHDVIYVYDNYFYLDKTTKILTANREQIKEIKGNYNEGW